MATIGEILDTANKLEAACEEAKKRVNNVISSLEKMYAKQTDSLRAARKKIIGLQARNEKQAREILRLRALAEENDRLKGEFERRTA